MKILELRDETFYQKSEELGICVIFSNVISNDFESATEHYFSNDKNDEMKFCYEKIEACDFGFKSTCYISETKIENFLLLTADQKTIYFNITNSEWAEDAKKYLDNQWDTRNEMKNWRAKGGSGLYTNPDNIEYIPTPDITKYFKKGLTNSFVNNHAQYIMFEGKIYANIKGGSRAGEIDWYEEVLVDSHNEKIEWYKEVLDSLGIENTDYIIHKGSYNLQRLI